MNQNTPREEEAFEAFCRETLLAAAASDDDIAAAAGAPFLHQRIRARIAAEEEQRTAAKANRGFLAPLLAPLIGWRIPRWAFVATASALVLLALTLTRGPREMADPSSVHTVNPPEDLTRNAPPMPNPTSVGIRPLAPPNTTARKVRRAARPRNMEEPEIATEYLPLTYVAQDEAEQSGNIVRVEAPRSALIALGIPVQGERSGGERSEQLIKADVIVGDDGLARAIRFVR